MRPRLPFLVLPLLIVGPAGCSSSSAQASAAADAGGAEGGPLDAASADSGASDVVTGRMNSSSPAPDASGPEDSGAGSADAAAEASVCVGLGAPCKDTSTCLCGTASGCLWDNVACTGGVCVVAQSVLLDAGEECCSACQAAYDGCTASAAMCLSQWKSCNTACPGGAGACPIVCAAEL